VNKREQNVLIKRKKVAQFPVFKELADFFPALPMLNIAQVRDLARGE
jgi:hypothetical protein